MFQIGDEDISCGGLCRYDGKSFRSFSSKDGLLSDNITVALEDGDGNLWLGTDMGIMKYDNPIDDTTFSFVAITTADGLISDYVTTIQKDRSGNLWFGTDKGVSKYDGENFQNIPLKKYFTLGFIEKIFEKSSPSQKSSL